MTYNSDDLTFISAQNGDILSDGLIQPVVDSEKSTLTFLWFLGNGSIAGDGEIAKLKFKISDKAKGDYSLKVTYLAEDLLDENRNPVAYTVTNGKISTGSTVSGSITSFGDTAAVTVRLLESEKELNNIQTTNGTYSFGSVSPGNYTVEVSKLNHVTRKYTVTVEREDITQDVKIHLIGDINGDGRINITDVGSANAHAKKSKLLTEYAFECADINGDEKINVSDVGKMNAHAKKTVMLYDQYTKYEFNGFGEGCMCLEDTHYEYSYTVDKNTVSIDFKNEAVHDCEYTFEVTDNTLTLVGGERTTGGTYKLDKVNN